MKKLLSIITLAVFCISLSAQVISNFPAGENFENGNINSSNVILYPNDWQVVTATESNNTNITSGHNNSNYFIYLYSSYDQTMSDLETYAFDLSNTDHAKLSFWYANPIAGEDFDILKIGFRSTSQDSYIWVDKIVGSNNTWTYYEIDLPVGKDLQICFRGELDRGEGVFLDDIKIDIPNFLTGNPVYFGEHFEDMEFWYQEFTNYTTDMYYAGRDHWTLNVGNANPDQTTYINSDQLDFGGNNAFFYSQSGMSSRLISPIFQFGNAPEAELNFWFSLEDYADEWDKLEVQYRTSPSSGWKTLINFDTEPINEWISSGYLELPELSDTYQISFVATGNYGYGVTLDDIRLYVSTNVSDAVKDSQPFSVYPNPATDHIFVNRTGNDEIFIYNAFGSLVKRTFENRIDISDLAPGLYTVKTNEGTVKIVK